MKRQILPIEALVPWAHLNEVELNNVTFGKSEASGTLETAETENDPKIDRGAALVATRDMTGSDYVEQKGIASLDVLMKVPSDLVLSLRRVKELATVDKHLREVLDAAGDLGTVSWSIHFASLRLDE